MVPDKAARRRRRGSPCRQAAIARLSTATAGKASADPDRRDRHTVVAPTDAADLQGLAGLEGPLG